ncbi:MAG TPA: AAA family ATPase [Candidatus Paceibacterota bacterium]|nr:AAA family ATPase [Candidatus Paceibacterota bacterium]
MSDLFERFRKTMDDTLDGAVERARKIAGDGTPSRTDPTPAERSLAAGSSGVISRFKDALTHAKGIITEQKEVLDALKAQPRPQAVVVDIRPERIRTDAHPTEFTAGAPVKVRETRGGNATPVDTRGVVEDDDLWADDPEYDVAVRLSDGQLEKFGTGHDRPDRDPLPRGLDLIVPAAVVVSFQGQRLDVEFPRHLTVRLGDTVSLSRKTLQIVEVVSGPGIGETAVVSRTLDATRSEVEWQGSSRIIVHAESLGAVAKGDRLVLDPTASAGVANLGKGQERFLFEERLSVSWDDIGGLDDAKLEFREVLELPYTEPELYKFYNFPMPKGILVYGPPGCGKTLLCKAAATTIKGGFFYVKGSEILDKYVGVAEGIIRSLFARARRFKLENGRPAVILIDEADAILYKRGTGVSSDVEVTIVAAFLAEMDGLEDSGAIVILATNRPSALDPAVVRDGRVDRRIYIPRPDRAAARTIAMLNLKKVPLAGKLTREQAADRVVTELFDTPRVLREMFLRDKEGNERTEAFTLAHVRNGAMVAAAVQQAVKFAMRRDRAAKKRVGVVVDDFAAGADALLKENLNLDHQDALKELSDALPTGHRLVGTKLPKGTSDGATAAEASDGTP